MKPIPKRSPRLAAITGLVCGLSLAVPVAWAADALFIDEDTIHVGANLNFGNRIAPLVTLWNGGYTIGIQASTMYFRTDRNFAWFKGGTHAAAELSAGAGGTPLMSLSSAPTAGKGTLDVSGTITGKGAVPAGAILMWSGDPAALPPGWVLCDGKNDTPDLSARFVVGFQPGNPDYAVGEKGGEAAHTLTPAEMPSHAHGPAGEHRHSIWASGHGWAFPVVQSGDSRVTGDSNTASTNVAGQHQHPPAGGGQPHENRPPYLALAYIMYTGK